MSVPFIIFPLAMVGFFVASEKIMSTRSRWKELSDKYRETPSPTLRWRGCRFLETEVRKGNTIYRASYGSDRFDLWARLFPRVFVAVDARGLHLKRLPWFFMHPPFVIPWSAVADIQTMGASDYSAGKVARQTGMSEQAWRARVPGAMSAVLQLAAGSITTVTLANPQMTLSVPADRIEDPQRFLVRRSTPTPAASSSTLAGSGLRPRAGITVKSSST